MLKRLDHARFFVTLDNTYEPTAKLREAFDRLG